MNKKLKPSDVVPGMEECPVCGALFIKTKNQKSCPIHMRKNWSKNRDRIHPRKKVT